MTQETNETNKKAAPKGTVVNNHPAEAAKTQPKPKPAPQMQEQRKCDISAAQEEVYAPNAASVPFLPNKAWLYLLPIAFIATITSVSLVFTGSSSSHQQQELQQLQTKFDGYQSGVKDSRN